MSFVTHNDKLVVAPNGKALSISGGTSLNLAYGLTAPEDTSKIWVKIQNEPEKVSVKSSFGGIRDIYVRGAGTANRSAYGVGAASVGDKIYILGGYNSGVKSYIDEFDTNTGVYQNTGASLTGSGGYSNNAVAVGSKIYMPKLQRSYYMGFDEYDTVTGQKQNFVEYSSSIQYGIAVAACGKYVYLFGGSMYGFTVDYSDFGMTTINVLDTENRTFSTLSASMPNRTCYLPAVTVDNKVYIFGGASRYNVESYIYTFDTNTQSISQLTTQLPSSRAYCCAAAIGTKIYIFGGISAKSESSRTNTIYMYDTVANSCVDTGITLPYAVFGAQAVTVRDKIYVIMGNTGSPSNSILEFSGTTDVPQNELQLIVGYGTPSSKIISSGNADIDLTVKLALLGDANGEGHPVEVYQYVNSEWTKIA